MKATEVLERLGAKRVKHQLCITRQTRATAELLLEELHTFPLAIVLDAEASDFVEWLWRRRHIHWLQGWTDRLYAIDASLPVCLARGREATP